MIERYSKVREIDYQIGNEGQIPCPWCKRDVSIQGITTDGCLKEGFVFDCPRCKEMIQIESVEYSATVFVVAVKETRTSE